MKKNLFTAAIAACVVFVASACGSGTGKTSPIREDITEGDPSVMDTLSYALGSNIGYGVKYQFADIPFDIKEITKGIKEAAFSESAESLQKNHEKAIESLQTYFMKDAPERRGKIYEKRRIEDSIRLASGDSTIVQHMADPDMFASEQERTDISYAFGFDIGTNLTNTPVPIQIDWLTKGFTEVHDGNGQLNEEEVNAYLQHYFMVVIPAENKEASEKWLADVEKQSGVHKTESGLLYRIEKAGDSKCQAANDRDIVVVKYEGCNRKGEVFDSSYERERDVLKRIKEVKSDETMTPENKTSTLARLEQQLNQMSVAEFPLNRVIRGWTEGMKLVGKGGKITLWIPSELAYGPNGAGPKIGPNEALRFEVEIVDVKPFEDPALKEAPAEEK